MLKKVTEASYLTAEKHEKYRVVLRFFYIQHERMRDFLFPEEVLAYVQEQREFSDYSLEELQNDLARLVQWGNLFARQEMSSARTIEEFKKKRFRYQCTPYTVEFERMLVQMEQQGDTFGGSLERTPFERLLEAIRKIEKMSETDEQCAGLWEDIVLYFKKITQDTSDYMAYITSDEASERMQTDAFLLYKDRFVSYLRDFVVSLQQTAAHIQGALRELEKKEMNRFFQQVIRHRDKTFRFEEKDADPFQELSEMWDNICSWFIGHSLDESEYERLQLKTNDAIRRITLIVQRMGERHQQFRSRKMDYLHVASWFQSISSLDESHRLSSVLFGVAHTKHLYSTEDATEDIYADIWDEAPADHEIMPRVQGIRTRTKADAMQERQIEKQAAREAFLKRRSEEQELVNQYIKDNKLVVRELGLVEPAVRKVMLGWIGRAMLRDDRTIKTEFGRMVKVSVLDGPPAALRSTDGQLTMPNVVFEFDGKESGI